MKLSAREVWRLVRPWWVSEERGRAYALLGAIVALDLFLTYIGVRQTYWQKNFFDALVERDLNGFRRQMMELALIIAGIVGAGTARVWLEQELQMRWRSWLTSTYLARWLGDRAYWRLEYPGDALDNPDQRIADDLRLMATDTVRLTVGVLNYVVDFFTFAALLWGLSGALLFSVGGTPMQVPGYMVWVAIGYALIGSVIIEGIGRGLVPVDYQQQRREADFRYLLVRVREHAASIALWRGEQAEHRGLDSAFQGIRSNWREVMRYTKRITAMNALYVQSSMLLPYLVTAPRYFAGDITVGTVMQLNSLFNRVRGALSWFVYRYKDLALLRSVFQRLHQFDQALQQPVRGGLTRTVEGQGLRIAGMQVERPNGSVLGRIERLTLAPGERLLVHGPSGSGKSLLLSALAGLWPFATGDLVLPQGRVMFVGQRSYLPDGTLHASVAYPGTADQISVYAVREVLHAVGLEAHVAHLNADTNWSQRLSLGEQQRLAFARVLLHRPVLVALDEATSALDVAAESLLYDLLAERLPECTVVSVAHRPSLQTWHGRHLAWPG
ncbi:ABC transporter ATP-binding protein/permease [Xanthomonas sp. 60]